MNELLGNPIFLAVVIPLVTLLVNIALENIKKLRAYRRLSADPLFHEGAVMDRLEALGHPEPLLVNCYIEQFKKGLVQVVTLDHDTAMTFTVREFIDLHPKWAGRPTEIEDDESESGN